MMKLLAIILRKGKIWNLRFQLLQKLSRFAAHMSRNCFVWGSTLCVMLHCALQVYLLLENTDISRYNAWWIPFSGATYLCCFHNACQIPVQVLCKLWLFVHFLSQDDEDEEEDDKEGGLSKSGKELKKLLGRTGGLDDSDAEDDDDDDDDVGYLFIYLWDTQS